MGSCICKHVSFSAPDTDTDTFSIYGTQTDTCSLIQPEAGTPVLSRRHQTQTKSVKADEFKNLVGVHHFHNGRYQAHTETDTCSQIQPQTKTSSGAPCLLVAIGAEKTQTKSAKVEESVHAMAVQSGGAPIFVQPSPKEELTSPPSFAHKEMDVPANHPKRQAAEFAKNILARVPTPKEAFEAALAWVKDPANSMKGVSNGRKLNLYKFYKQAKDGNVQGSQPWAAKIEARAKWDAWNSVKGMSSDEAMKRYVEELESQKQQYRGK